MGYLLIPLRALFIVWALLSRALPFLLLAWLLLLSIGAADDFLRSASVDPASQAAVLAALRGLRAPRAGAPLLLHAARLGCVALAAACAVVTVALAWRLRLRLPPPRGGAASGAPPPPPRLRWEAWALLCAGGALLYARRRRLARFLLRRGPWGGAAPLAVAPPAPAPAPPGAAPAPPPAPAPAAPQAPARGGVTAAAAAAARAELFFGIAAAAGLAPDGPAMSAVPARALLPS
jgi:hypothetical protein